MYSANKSCSRLWDSGVSGGYYGMPFPKIAAIYSRDSHASSRFRIKFEVSCRQIIAHRVHPQPAKDFWFSRLEKPRIKPSL